MIGIATQGGTFAVTAYQARGVLGNTTMFGRLSNVFDQFKINAIKVRVVPLDMDSIAGAAVSSCIAWDRDGPVNLENLTYDALCTYGSAKTNYYSLNTKTI